MSATEEWDPRDILIGLSHPVRRGILRVALDAKHPISPSQTAGRLTAPLSSLSYHFRVLRERGLLSLAGIEEKRGALQHLYVIDPVVPEYLPWVRVALGED